MSILSKLKNTFILNESCLKAMVFFCLFVNFVHAFLLYKEVLTESTADNMKCLNNLFTYMLFAASILEIRVKSAVVDFDIRFCENYMFKI